VVVTENQRQDLNQGTSGNRVLSSTETSDWKRYRTRVMSNANKVNLKFDQVAPDLVAGLTRSITNISEMVGNRPSGSQKSRGSLDV
jgi:Enterobacterial TraT complement resistance protein